MKRNILSILLFCFVYSILLSGCQISYGKSTDYLGLLDDNRLVYRISTKQNAMYYTYNSVSKETIYLGRTENNFMHEDNITLLNGHLYFYDYLTTDSGKGRTVLHDIDLLEHSISEVPREKEEFFPNFSSPLKDTLVTLEQDFKNDIYSSMLSFYHPDSGTWSHKPLGIYDSQKNIGIYPISMYADGTSLYLIQKEADNPEQENYFIIQYDVNGEQLRRILLSGDIRNFVEKGRIWSMYVWENYLYLAGHGEFFTGYIKEEQIYTITQDELFLSQTLYPDDTPVFYNHYENCYYTPDTISGGLLKYSHQMLTGYPNEFMQVLAGSQYRTYLQSLFTSRDTVAAIVHYNKGPMQVYFSSPERIGDITV